MKIIPNFHRVLKDQLDDYITAISWSIDDSLFAISASGELIHFLQSGSSWSRLSLGLKGTEDKTVSNSNSQPNHDKAHHLLSQEALSCVGVSNDGNYLAVGGQEGKLWIWGLLNNEHKLLQVHDFGTIWIDQLAWNPAQSIFAVAIGRDVQLWQYPFSKPFQIFKFEASTVLNLSWHPQGDYLAVGGHHGVKIWDIREPSQTSMLEVPGASLCSSWSPNGAFLASGNLDRTISVLNHNQPPPWLMQGFPGKVSCVDWMQSDRVCLAAVASDGISIWTRGKEHKWDSKVLTGHQSLIRDIGFQPNGNLLASAGNEQKIMIWSDGKKLQQTLRGPLEGTHCLAWNPSGKMLALGGMDGEILIFLVANEAKGFG